MDEDIIENGRAEMLRNWTEDPNDPGTFICDRCGFKTYGNSSGRYSNLWEHELMAHRD